MKVSCETHGQSRAAFVCDHIVKTLCDGVARGLVWERDEGHINACCSQCNQMIASNNDDWSDEIIEKTGLNCICEGCVISAASINNVEVFG